MLLNFVSDVSVTRGSNGARPAVARCSKHYWKPHHRHHHHISTPLFCKTNLTSKFTIRDTYVYITRACRIWSNSDGIFLRYCYYCWNSVVVLSTTDVSHHCDSFRLIHNAAPCSTEICALHCNYRRHSAALRFHRICTLHCILGVAAQRHASIAFIQYTVIEV